MCGYNPHAIDKVLQLLVLGFGDLLCRVRRMDRKNDTALLNRRCDHCLRSPHRLKSAGTPLMNLPPSRFINFGNLIVGLPTVENHADSVVLDRLPFAHTEFDEVGSGELGRQQSEE